LGVLAFWFLMGFGLACADLSDGATNEGARDFTHPSSSCRAARRRDPALRGFCRPWRGVPLIAEPGIAGTAEAVRAKFQVLVHRRFDRRAGLVVSHGFFSV